MPAPFSSHPDPPRPGWLGPFAAPRALAGSSWTLARSAEALSLHPAAPLLAVAVGALPLLAAPVLGPAHQVIAAALLFPLFLGTVPADRAGRGLLLVGLCFVAHNALAIGLAARDPAIGAAMPGAAAYWEVQQAWITTGHDPEYEVTAWLPAHGQLFAAVSVSAYLSLGLVTFAQGFYEVDLMNFYVGRLMAHSGSPAQALLLGWHPWSVLRGLSYVVLTWEVASWSLARMTRRTLSTPERRLLRWVAAGGLFWADCATKLAMLEVVRRTLAGNLAVPLGG